MEKSKVWWMSKTVWTNLFALIGSIVLATGVDEARWAEIATVALAAVNLALRFVTNEPIGSGSELSGR